MNKQTCMIPKQFVEKNFPNTCSVLSSSENIESFYAELDRYMYAEAQEGKFPKEVNNDTKKIMES